MSYTVKITGIREVRRSLDKGSDQLKRFDEELKEPAKLVAAEADRRGSRYAQIGPFKPARRGANALVQQSKRKVNRKHPDFGSLQMARVLIPAAEAKEPEVMDWAERWLDQLARSIDL